MCSGRSGAKSKAAPMVMAGLSGTAGWVGAYKDRSKRGARCPKWSILRTVRFSAWRLPAPPHLLVAHFPLCPATFFLES